MITNELFRKKILDDAFHGNLVDNDTTLKPINIDEVNDDVPYRIPLNWKWIKYSDITESRMGRTILSSDLVESGIPVYSATQSDNIFGYVKDSSLLLHNGDIVIPARGNSIGCVTLVKDEVATCTQTTIYSHITSNFVLPEYLTYCCKFFKTIWFKYSGAAIPQVTVGQINKNLVPIPPFEEQKRIVDKIDELFYLLEKKESNDQQKENLKVLLKEKILDSAIHGTLVENDVTLESVDCDKSTSVIPFEIPNNWKWISIKDISYSVYDGSHNPPKDSGVGIPILSALNIHDNKININEANRFVTLEDYAKEDKKINYQKGDVLLTIVGTVGRTAIIDFDDKFCLQRSVSIIKPKEFIYSKYLMYFLESKHCLDIYKEEAKGTAQAGFYLKKLKELSVSVPPLEEQKRIVEKIESLFELIEQL